MDTMVEEQLDYEDEEYGGAQKMQYPGGGAIPALADDEMMGEDDDYDDLYSDVNVGDSFLQLQQSEAPVPPGVVGNGRFQAPKVTGPEPRMEARVSQGSNLPGVLTDGKYSNAGTNFSEQKVGISSIRGSEMGSVEHTDGAPVSEKGRVMEMTHETQVRNSAFQGSLPTPHKTGSDPTEIPGKLANEPPPLLKSGNGGTAGVQSMPTNHMRISVNMNSNVNHPMVNENQIRPAVAVENGSTMLFVGELHWWTTDAELESVLTHYGRVKEIKFFDERASGKSKGYCQVEFFDPSAAATCKEKMNGHLFNGRACVVAFASPQTLKQMGASYVNKNPVQPQVQPQERRPLNDGVGRGGGMNYSGGDAGRNYGRGGWGRGGQGMPNRGPGGGPPMRGRGGAIGARGIVGNNAGVGGGVNSGGYGQGFAGPAFGGPAGAMNMMYPQGVMGAGFDPTYMGRGGSYGGFPGSAFPGMLPSYPAINTMGLAGVAPHVNPAFFGRGMAPNGMGMMGPTGMEGHHAGMWTENTMSGWRGEEHGRRTRESSYGGDDGVSDYGYGEASYEKGVRSNAVSREKECGSEPDLSGNPDRRHRNEKEHDRDRSDRDQRYREDRDGHRDNQRRDRDLVKEDDWDRGQSSTSRSRSRVISEEDQGSRSRDVDYGKRRRLPSE